MDPHDGSGRLAGVKDAWCPLGSVQVESFCNDLVSGVVEDPIANRQMDSSRYFNMRACAA